MKTLLSTVALTALLAAPLAAQDTTPTQPEQLPETQMQQEMPKDPLLAPEASPGQSMEGQQDSAAAAPADQPKFLASQANDQVLASEIIGATVHDASEAELGDVADIVYGADNEIVALIVGVGGFLGIGEKQVGVSLSQFVIENDADGNVSLTLDATAEELEAAAAFKTLADARAEAEAEAAAQQREQLPANPPAQPAQ